MVAQDFRRHDVTVIDSDIITEQAHRVEVKTIPTK